MDENMTLLGLRNCGLLMATTSSIYSYSTMTRLYQFTGSGEVAWSTQHSLGAVMNTGLFEKTTGELILVGNRPLGYCDDYYCYGDRLPFLAQFSADGALLSTRDNIFPGRAVKVNDAVILPDDGIVVAGHEGNYSYWVSYPVLMRLGPPFAEIKWEADFSDMNYATFEGVTTTSDGNLIAVGRQENEFYVVNGLVVKLDMDGNVLWQREIDRAAAGMGPNRSYDVIKLLRVVDDIDGGCVVAGHAIDQMASYYDSVTTVFVIAFDTNGNKRWSAQVSTGNDSMPVDLVRLLNGHYAVTIYTYVYSGYTTNLALLSDTGQVRVQTIERNQYYDNFALAPLNDGGLAKGTLFPDGTSGVQTYSLETLEHWGE
jgi:hypothetical protein